MMARSASHQPTFVYLAWREVRAHWFRSMLGLVSLALIGIGVWNLVNWAILQAVWTGDSRRECAEVSVDGACWASLIDWWPTLTFGLYPPDQIWRIAVMLLLLGLTGYLVVAGNSLVARIFSGAASAVLGPFAILYLLGGQSDLVTRWGFVLLCIAVFCGANGRMRATLGNIAISWRHGRGIVALLACGLAGVIATQVPMLSQVAPSKWGGLTLTLILSVGGILYGFPLGIVLALGRRSKRAMLRRLSGALVEIVRALPLTVVLITCSLLLPRVWPAAAEIHPLLRATAALVLFNAVYFAEIVRSGLQAIPPGQYEAAAALGFSYARAMSLIFLPQAIRTMVPAIVALLANIVKDTALVSVIGIFDLLNAARAIGKDPAWLGTIWEPLILVAVIYFAVCFGMSAIAHRVAQLKAR